MSRHRQDQREPACNRTAVPRSAPQVSGRDPATAAFRSDYRQPPDHAAVPARCGSGLRRDRVLAIPAALKSRRVYLVPMALALGLTGARGLLVVAAQRTIRGHGWRRA